MKKYHARKKRGARKAPAQSATSGFTLHAHVPTRYPQFPRQLQFSSHWTQTSLDDLSGSTFNRRVGLFDFLGNIPEYALEMFSLYRYCRIVGVDVHLLAVGQHQDGYDNAFEAAMAKVPYDQSLSPVPPELRLVRGSVYGLASSLGANRINLKRHYGAIDELGNPVYSREFWQNAAGAALS